VLTAIDHLVVVVPDLDEAVRRWQGRGFAPVPGGRHPHGTHNALIALADGSYVELIAFWEPTPAHRWWKPLQAGGGLIDVCLATDDLAADIAAWRAAGVAMDDPRPFRRVRPDGYEVRWRLAIPQGAHRGVAPFLIEDDTPRTERVPHQTAHANGAAGVASITLAVPDLAEPYRWYAGALGRPGVEIAGDDLDATGVRFAVGPHAIDLVTPHPVGAGLLHAWLTARGPSPFSATLYATGSDRASLTIR
jgi:catechol 2,3-dioxygenase-like lactoylglutathione lyase family enzyme